MLLSWHVFANGMQKIYSTVFTLFCYDRILNLSVGCRFFSLSEQLSSGVHGTRFPVKPKSVYPPLPGRMLSA